MSDDKARDLVEVAAAEAEAAKPKPIRLLCRLGIHRWGSWVDDPDRWHQPGMSFNQRRRCLCCNITERSCPR